MRSKTKELDNIDFSDFEMQMVIGRGAFGKVFLAKLKTNEKSKKQGINGNMYAIKAIRKDILI